MRPLELTFKGLRSYLQEQTIDFRSASLMAIVGETGAGKSSILEAMYFALFGTCTWDGKNSKVLIAHGGDGTLRASLTFAARGKTWKITRSVSHGLSPGSVHRLECTDDATILTGNDNITARVRRLIGLDEKTFLRSVILPQGRFQQLLQTSPRERAGILKRILGLDQLDSIREDAAARLLSLAPKLEALKTERALLHPDPGASADGAASRLNEQQSNLAALRSAREHVDKVKSEQSALTTRTTALTTSIQQLRSATDTSALDRLDVLAALDDRLTAELGEAENEHATTSSRAADLVAALASAGSTAAGTGPASQAAAALAELTTLVKQIGELEPSVAREKDRLATAAVTAAHLRRCAEQATTDTKAAQDTAAKAQKHTESISKRHEQLARQLADLRQAQNTEVHASRRIEILTGELSKAESAATTAESLMQQATLLLDETQAAQARQQSLSAAAEAAAHAGPGDDCPVCHRQLPGDFTPPSSPDLTQATKAVTAAKRQHTKRVEEAASASGRAHAHAQQLAELSAEHLQAAGDLHQQQAALTGHIGGFQLESQDDAAILHGSQQAIAAGQQLFAQTSAEYTRLHGLATAADAAASAAERQLSKDDRAHAKLTARLHTLREQTQAQVEKIPAPFRPAILLEADIASHAAAAEKARREETKAWQQVEHYRAAAGVAGIKLRQLEQRHTREVTTPAQQLHQQMQAMAQRHDDLAALLGRPHLEPGNAADPLPSRKRWAIGVTQTAATLQAEAQQRIQQLALESQQYEQELSHILTGAPTEGRSLEDAFEIAAGRVAVAQQTLADIQAQIPRAKDLDERITGTAPHVSSLRVLTSLLTDAKFIGAVVASRQLALLGTATVLLRNMTRHRFAFAPDFQIYDGNTGQLRDTKTLSGGETFQASLALALAVVEQLGSTGGRAEALFLDEGFASLDAASLADALDALSQQVQAGRLVAVISHLKAVAEHVPQVLVASKTRGGSEVHWADDHQRALLADADLYGGLHG